MGGTSEFLEIVRAFHKSNVIEDSRGGRAEKAYIRDRRKAAEKQANSILQRKWGEWSYMDLGDIIENVNWNGFDGPNMRFSRQFLINLDRIEVVGIETTREALLCLLDDDRDLGDRVKEAQGTYGSDAPGMFSSILYIHDPLRYAPLFKPIVKNLNRFVLESRLPLKTSLADYGRYCSIMKEVENKYKIPPQLSDYVLSTWINVWEKYR